LNCRSNWWSTVTPTISRSEATTVTTTPATTSPTIVPFSISRFQELIDAQRLKKKRISTLAAAIINNKVGKEHVNPDIHFNAPMRRNSYSSCNHWTEDQ